MNPFRVDRRVARQEQWARLLAFALTIALLVVAVFVASVAVGRVMTDDILAQDLNAYVGFTKTWLSGGEFYLPGQLTGRPYVVEDLFANVYPPTILFLTVPFALGLPAVLWWAIPLAIIGMSFWVSRPAWWAWPLVAFVLANPRTWTILVTGNPSMWAIAAAVAGAVWRWPAVGAALKTTFLPLTLIGVRHRTWWVAAVIAVILALPFGTMWFDYVSVLRFASSSRGTGYVLGEWPIAIALVLAAWRWVPPHRQPEPRPAT